MSQHKQTLGGLHATHCNERKNDVKTRFKVQRRKCSSQLLYQVRQQNHHRQEATECNKAKIGVSFFCMLCCSQIPRAEECRSRYLTAACKEHGGAVAAAVTEKAASVTPLSPALFSCWHSWWHFLLRSHPFFSSCNIYELDRLGDDLAIKCSATQPLPALRDASYVASLSWLPVRVSSSLSSGCLTPPIPATQHFSFALLSLLHQRIVLFFFSYHL